MNKLFCNFAEFLSAVIVTMLVETKNNYTYLKHGYINYRNDLLHYAMIETQNKSLADDLVQNTFLKTWIYMVKGGRVNVMKGFLFHVLKTMIIYEFKKNQVVSLEVLTDRGWQISDDHSEKLNENFEKKQVIELIDELPRMYQQVLRLRYVQNLTIDEIAKITGRTKNAVTVQSHRGLKKLKDLYLQKSNSSIAV